MRWRRRGTSRCIPWPTDVYRTKIDGMTRVVGNQDRDEFETDPVLAYRRGRALDRLLTNARTQAPRGVLRATHTVLNRLDDDRAVEAARRLNIPR